LAEILASLIKGPPTTTTTTKQNVYPAVHCVYSRVKSELQNSFLYFCQPEITRNDIVACALYYQPFAQTN
jgi:hypothetical protein